MAEQSRETQLLSDIIDSIPDGGVTYDKPPKSRNEEILLSILNDTEYTKTPQSREEELLLELKEKIGELVPPTPSGASKNDVNFYDYDGTIVYSYTKEQFSALEAMPENPTHEGLTAQGWNYTLEKAKEYVSAYGSLDVGQMYITSDGKTRAVIRLEEGRLSPRLGLGLNGTATIDWGDGTAEETMTGSNINSAVYKTHNYASAGEYTISISVEGQAMIFGSSSFSRFIVMNENTSAIANKVYSNSVLRIYLGNNILIHDYAFQNCFSLASITIPNSVTSIGADAFQYCYSLASITIPNGVTSIATVAFNFCYSLASITIPNGVTSIGANAFQYCYSLVSVTIPNSVTSIGASAFSDCHSLTSVTIPNGITSIGNYLFSGCSSLEEVKSKNGLTNTGVYMFQNCLSISKITISNTTTSIAAAICQNCHSLASITIPNGVTSIGANAFNSCYCIGVIKFESTTPPSVSNVSAWQNVPADCKILVPAGTLETYKAAANYPNPSTYTYEEYVA